MSAEPPHDLSRLKIDRSGETEGWTIGASRRSVLVVAALTVAGVAALFLLYPRQQEEIAREAAGKDVHTVASRALPSPSQSLIASGYVVAQRQAAVSSKATGRLKTLLVQEGDTVKKDQLIGALENDDIRAQLKEQEANFKLLTARASTAEAELEEANIRKKRMDRLRKINAVSQDAYEQAYSRHKKAVSDLAAARANVEVARALIEKSKVDLNYTQIYAPFDGTVLSKNAELGEIVAPFGSSSDARAAIVTIADMDSLEVEADVSEGNLSRVFIGQKCEITLDSFPNKIYKGLVDKIVPTVDRAKATVLTKIKFLDIDRNVIPEMSAKVSFHLNNE